MVTPGLHTGVCSGGGARVTTGLWSAVGAAGTNTGMAVASAMAAPVYEESSRTGTAAPRPQATPGPPMLLHPLLPVWETDVCPAKLVG